jgi:hypothetical protein
MNKWTLDEFINDLPADHRTIANRLIKDLSTFFTVIWSDKKLPGNKSGRTDPGFRAHYRYGKNNYTFLEYGSAGDIFLKIFEVSRHPPFSIDNGHLICHFNKLASISSSKGSGKLKLDTLLNEDNYNQFISGLHWFIQVINNPETYENRSINIAALGTININTGTIPSKEDFESAYRMLTHIGEYVSVDKVLDQIETNAVKIGQTLKSDWRMITEKSIQIWSRRR